MTTEGQNRFLKAGRIGSSGRRIQQEMLSSLQPMKTGQLLDRSLRIYQRFGVAFLRQSMFPSLICLAAITFINKFVFVRLAETKNPGDIVRQVGEAGFAIGLGLFVGLPLLLLGIIWCAGLVTELVSGYIIGDVPDEDEAAERTRGVMPRLIKVIARGLVTSMAGIGSGIGILLIGGLASGATDSGDATAGIISFVGIFVVLVGIGLFFNAIAKDALSPTIAVLEQGASAKEISHRSRTLLKKSTYHATGTDMVVSASMLLGFIALLLYGGTLLSFAVINVDAYVDQLIDPGFVRTVLKTLIEMLPSFLVIWTLVPAWAAIMTLIYYDRRIRLEGFDIEALASQVKVDAR